MNNIRNKLLDKKTLEQLISKYIDVYENAIKQKTVVHGVDNNTYKKSIININNIKNIQKAFIHKSFSVVDPDNSDSDSYSCINIKFTDNYERGEFLGDRIIELITAEFLYFNYKNKDPKFLTEVKSRIVRKDSLANLGTKLGFKEYMLIGGNIERVNGRDNQRFLEDMFESFIAMLYIDQRLDKELCKQFILGVYISFIDFDDIITNNINYKTSLQHYFHKMKYSHPIYNTLYHIGPTYSREFTVVVLIPKDLYSHSDSVNLTNINNSISCIVLNDLKNPLLNTQDTPPLEILNGLLSKGILVGIGKSNTKQTAEQACSMDCLKNLNIQL